MFLIFIGFISVNAELRKSLNNYLKYELIYK